MKPSARRSPLFLTVALTLALPLATLTAAAQTQTQKPPAPARPSTAKPTTAKPSTAKPAQPTAKPAAPEPVKAPAPPPPQDVRFKAVYKNGEMKTESVTYIKGARERFEFQDMVLLKQPDQKRTIQISKSANTYLVSPEGMPAPGVPGAAPAAPPKPPGVIMVATTIVDTSERKEAFGQQARHVKLMIDKQPMAGACDSSKQRIETDGWYIDNPPSIANRPSPTEQTPASPDGCTDQIQATSNGDPKVLGFPIAYTTTLTGDDGKPVVSTMEVTEFEATTLDPALFEIPGGFNAVMNIRELSKALSDANEAKLVAASSESTAAPIPKTPGVVRIGVPELTNKTPQAVDTRALRQRLIGDLTEAKFDAVPMPAGTPADLQKRAGELGYDYVLFAEVSELKVNKPGGFGGLMKAAGGVAGGRGGVAGMAAGAAAGAAAPPKENTESSLAVKLVQPDGKQRLSTTSKGKDGSGFSLKSGLGIAKYAGGMYLGMMAGPMMYSKLAGAGAFSNMGGMGMLGNPMLYRMQGAGMTGLGKGMGMDATAGAAAYLMQNAMTMDNLGGYVGVPGQGPSYDESLGEAVQNAAKAVQKALEKK
jgi:hypothetical protein